MEIRDIRIDQGKAFDWGRASKDYARYRDIYPEIFYQKIRERGIGIKGQKVLDLGTGTGVLPRNMYKYGAEWTGTDISPEQIREARRLAGEAGMKIDFFASAAEDLDFPPASFDAVTACQCFLYFDHRKVMPLIRRFLKKDGGLLILYMAWLPFEDPIAGKSEELVLKYNPCWSGAGERIHPIEIPEEYFSRFCLEDHEEMELMIPFTRETWHGRMRSCRGTAASLSPEDLEKWDREHRAFLLKEAPEEFPVRHYMALAVLRKRS